MTDIKTLDSEYIAGTYNRVPVVLTHGKGSLVYDENGKEYIDMGSGIGVTAFGISDDKWVEVVTEQLNTLQHMSNLYYTEPGVLLAKVLCERTGLKKVFFGNSGAEANECAIKAARKFAALKKGPDYNVIVTLKNSFHGRTLTTLAATGQEHYHELYAPLTPGFAYAEANNIEDLKQTVKNNKTAAILIECIQGEGGVNVLNKDFVKEAEQLARDNDILLMVDEVQTGNGRTGKLYAYMNYDITPDVVTTAKGLGGGLPIGACLLGGRVENIFDFGDHGSTFGANPVVCAGALSIISRIDDTLLEEVQAKNKLIIDTLSGQKGIKAISGMGFMIGIETEKPASEIVNTCRENGVLCLTAKDRVRLLPALNIPEEVLIKALNVIKDACA